MAAPTETPTKTPTEKWNAILERILEGDPVAFAKFSRLLTGFLVQLRAYDFEDEWDDLRQEVLTSVIANARAGRLRDPKAFVGYVKIITRNKFADRLKRRLRHQEKDSLPWDDEAARSGWDERTPEHDADTGDLWRAVGELPDEQKRIVESVYAQGLTYREASHDIGMPLGTLKRKLTQGLATLRRRLEEPVEDG